MCAVFGGDGGSLKKRVMMVRSAEFVKAAVRVADCPAADLPEFAFIGRSNVGKSSLINLLTNRKALARVSKTPGCTREILFFKINEAWNLVDLPGYGYAKVSKSRREEFNDFVSAYLTERESLRGVFVLIDSRHKPQKVDLEFVGWLVEMAIPFALVFTKVDKIKPRVVTANRDLFLAAMKEFADGEPVVLQSSAMTREGRGEILKFIEAALAAG